MKLLLEEHFSFRIAEQLRSKRFDVLAVVERPELRAMSDEDLLRWAHRAERAIVTENVRDFLPLHGEFLRQGEAHSGIVLTSPRRFGRRADGIGELVKALGTLMSGQARTSSMASDVHWL